MDKQIENMAREILNALEEGTALGKKNVINACANSDMRDLMLASCEACAGYIGMAICEVIKRYTEEGK